MPVVVVQVLGWGIFLPHAMLGQGSRNTCMPWGRIVVVSGSWECCTRHIIIPGIDG